MNLDIISWKDFVVNDLFEIINGKGITSEEIENNPGDLEAVQSGEGNTGVMGLIDRSYCRDMDYSWCEESCLTVARSGTSGFVSFHKNGCVVGDSAKILLLKDRNARSSYVYLFIQTLLKANRFKYTYGRKVTEALYGKTIIKLPSTADGAPDWQWMEGYISSLHSSSLTTCNVPGSIPIRMAAWKEFTVNDILMIINGKGITNEEIEDNPGDFEAVQSGEGNNGVMGLIDRGYCREMGYSFCMEPCLSVARSGTSGFVSLHKNGCVVGDSAKILLLKDKNARSVYVYLFIQTLLAANRFKYTYGRKVTESLYGRTVIKLPVTEDGNPDWQWMENYIRLLPYGDKL